jgi:hypothetical protein
MRPARRRSERGQATVELALVLPLVVTLLLVIVQGGVLARDQVLVTHAAREAVRAAAVDPDEKAIEQAARDAGPLDHDRLGVDIGHRGQPGSRVTVRITYRAPAHIPLIGRLLSGVDLHAAASMRVER